MPGESSGHRAVRGSQFGLCGIYGYLFLVKDAAGKQFEMECDSIVLSLGVKQNLELADQFRNAAPDHVVIGDCATAQGTLYNATNTAFAAAMNIG